MASKAINIKIARTKVIKALEVKLEEMSNQKMNYELLESKYETDHKEWKDKVAQIAYVNFDIASASKKAVSIRNAWGNDENIRVDIEVEVAKDKIPAEPEAPKNPFQTSGYGRTYIGGYEDRVAEIQNAIRMLSMSDEEVVSTSTYQSVSRYL
jgi:hypothetical protein